MGAEFDFHRFCRVLALEVPDAVIYADQKGNVLARFCVYETFVDCLDALLKLEPRSHCALVESKPLLA